MISQFLLKIGPLPRACHNYQCILSLPLSFRLHRMLATKHPLQSLCVCIHSLFCSVVCSGYSGEQASQSPGLTVWRWWWWSWLAELVWLGVRSYMYRISYLYCLVLSSMCVFVCVFVCVLISEHYLRMMCVEFVRLFFWFLDTLTVSFEPDVLFVLFATQNHWFTEVAKKCLKTNQ